LDLVRLKQYPAERREDARVGRFNLLPVWQLDGGRGFRALTRGQRWIAAALIGAMWLVTGEGLLVTCSAVPAAAAR
jgi:Zn-dependent protease